VFKDTHFGILARKKDYECPIMEKRLIHTNQGILCNYKKNEKIHINMEKPPTHVKKKGGLCRV
jgi:hypothetical protein